METFYDGYVVNAIIDACYKSMKSGRWEQVELEVWRGREIRDMSEISGFRIVSREFHEDAPLVLIKSEKMPDGRIKFIFKDKATGRIVETIE